MDTLKYKQGFRFLSYDFIVRSNSKSIVSEFKKLYSYLISSHIEEPKEIYSVFIEKNNCSDSPHTISSRHETVFETTNEREALPLLEWLAINDAGDSLNDYLQIHAAFLEKDGRGFLFPLDPGKGKSTLTLGLIQDGFRYLTDEVALINPKNLIVNPFPRSLCIKEGSFPLFEDLKKRIQPKDYFLKFDKFKAWYLNPLEIDENCMGTPTPIDYIVFLEFDPKNEPRLEKTSRSKTTLAMTKQCFNFGFYKDRGVDIILSVAGRAKCFTLFSNSLETSVKMVNGLLSSS